MLIALALLAAIAAPADEDAPTPGTIAVQIEAAEALRDDMAPALLEAARDALSHAQFIPLPDAGHSRYVARLAVSEVANGVVSSPGASGGATATPSLSGGGLSMSLPTRKQQLHPLIVTRLVATVSLRRDDRVVWTGEATTARASGTPAGAPGAVATALSNALFRWFPHRLEGPLSVP
ncbi:hypothetical protein [Sphingomonas sp. BK235]|uniref:hypothetical protein n=1 Tax=Sphingomonas sp. BK235 TaxID=2512131 RepID=UPI0010487B91|nr:hypothetical protein [Sphingomonas sp. BK235]TCP35025.1 hypothetical protein EV292_103455 [Sphingomonas sp. BK235]